MVNKKLNLFQYFVLLNTINKCTENEVPFVSWGLFRVSDLSHAVSFFHIKQRFQTDIFLYAAFANEILCRNHTGPTM